MATQAASPFPLDAGGIDIGCNIETDAAADAGVSPFGVAGSDASRTEDDDVEANDDTDSNTDDAGDTFRTDGERERDRPAYTLLTTLAPPSCARAIPESTTTFPTPNPIPILASCTPTPTLAGVIVSSELLGEVCTSHCATAGLGCTTRS